MHVPLVDLLAQERGLGPQILGAIDHTLSRGDFVLGEEVSVFEQEFAKWTGTQFAIGVDSGTSALELILRSHGVGSGDEVIIPANTFIATALAVVHAGATPVLVDVEPETLTMDPALLRRAITSRTRAIIPVHLYGHPADIDEIRAVAAPHGLVVIEDACQAHGASYRGRSVGSLGDAAAFSFYPSKNLGACGDGGIVVTDDSTVAESVRALRNYGQTKKYHHKVLGFNRRLDTLQAAVLRVKLPYLHAWNDERRGHAASYQKLLSDTPLGLPVEQSHAKSVWHLYVVRTSQRDLLLEHLIAQGVGAGIHYPIPIHLQPAFSYLPYEDGDFPVTEHYATQILSLPMYPELTGEQLEVVADAIHKFDFDEARKRPHTAISLPTAS